MNVAVLCACASSSPTDASRWPLSEDIGQVGIVAPLVAVVHTDVAGGVSTGERVDGWMEDDGGGLPLQVVRTRIAVLLVKAEGTLVSRRAVDELVADHFVLALEALAALGMDAVLDGTVVGSFVGVDVCMRTGPVRNKSDRRKVWGRGEQAYLRRYWVWKGSALQPGCGHL